MEENDTQDDNHLIRRHTDTDTDTLLLMLVHLMHLMSLMVLAETAEDTCDDGQWMRETADDEEHCQMDQGVVAWQLGPSRAHQLLSSVVIEEWTGLMNGWHSARSSLD